MWERDSSVLISLQKGKGHGNLQRLWAKGGVFGVQKHILLGPGKLVCSTFNSDGHQKMQIGRHRLQARLH
ncbi:hypothetical protein V6N12_012172 [Hibiscus sabdariffa]|uniref:Uncharacterized protein n=1 Tax=Hibiscus sabdariffa TaxID=183260 RepID=A0ABR2CHU5_9ROSI